MTKEKGGKLRYIYGICLAFFTVIVGILFIVQTWSIFRSAPESPFTVKSISSHFKQIALPVWLWVAAIVGNIALAYVFPEEKARLKATVDERTALVRVRRRLPLEGSLADEGKEIGKKQRIFRLSVSIVCGALAVLMATVCALILFGVTYSTWVNKEFFVAHNAAVDKLLQCVVYAAFALICCSVGKRLIDGSYDKERKAYTNLLVEAKKQGIPANKPAPVAAVDERKAEKRVLIIRLAVALVGVTLFIVGIANGGMRDVLLKAVNICTQCIGLG